MEIDDSGRAGGFARRAAVGAVYLGGAQVIRVILTLLSAIVIAHFLSPADYGVVAMAAPVIGVITMFQDLGLGTATVQSRTLNDAEATGMFWVNTVASLAIAAALVAIAPFAAWFYGDYRAGYVTAAGALGVLLSGIALQHAALLNREMRFGISSAIDVINAFTTFAVAALLALWLRSYWALILGTLAGTAVQTVLMWRSAKWMPGRISFTGASRFAKFSSGVTGFNLVNFISRNADNILIAKAAGSASLGLYDRSYKLMMLPLQTLNGPLLRLLLPILSKMQDEPERYRRTFVFAIRAVGLITIPGVAISAVLSNRLMPFLLGPAWTEAGPIFFWLGLAGLFNPVGNLTGLLFLSSGRTGPFFRWGLFSAIITVGGFAIGIPWGAEGVAASLFFSTAVRMPLLFVYSVRGTGVKPLDLFRAQFEPIMGSLPAAALALKLEPYFDTVPLLCLSIAIAYGITLLFALATEPGRRTVFGMYAIAKDSLKDLGARVRKRPGLTD